MAGASPPGPTDTVNKPTQTKDGTSALTPGQSQGATGASPGGPTPAAANATVVGKGASIKITPPADVPTASDGNALFSITADPKMPVIKLTLSIVGITSGPDPTPKQDFEWTASVSYDSKKTKNGISSGACTFKGAPAKGTTRKIAAITTSGKVTGGAIAISFDKIRGGDLTITVTATIGTQVIKGETKGWRIQGTNPDFADVNKVLPDDAFRRLTCLESQKKQFVPSSGEGNAMYPQFSGDGCLGVGICQLTNPQPTDDEIWDWTQNVKAGVDLYNEKRNTAKGYPALVSKSANFIKLAKEYTDNLKKAVAPAPGTPQTSPAQSATSSAAAAGGDGKAAPPAAGPAPPTAVQVKVPEFTEDQLQDDTIRGFNGWAGDDEFTTDPHTGRKWMHEFRIKRDPKTNALVVDGDAKTGTVNALWERVPSSARPSSGDPNYVDDVKKYDPGTCKKTK